MLKVLLKVKCISVYKYDNRADGSAYSDVSVLKCSMKGKGMAIDSMTGGSVDINVAMLKFNYWINFPLEIVIFSTKWSKNWDGDENDAIKLANISLGVVIDI